MDENLLLFISVTWCVVKEIILLCISKEFSIYKLLPVNQGMKTCSMSFSNSASGHCLIFN